MLDAHLDVTVENDLDIKLSYRRPARSPLVFDAVYLPRLAGRAMAGVVLTATGARTFLGQKVLRPDDAAFEIPITAEAEAPGHAAAAGFSRLPPARRRAHPDRRRSPAVPARPAGRLPPFPDRRGHRHLLHGRPLGDAGARGAGRGDAARPGRRAADRRDDRVRRRGKPDTRRRAAKGVTLAAGVRVRAGARPRLRERAQGDRPRRAAARRSSVRWSRSTSASRSDSSPSRRRCSSSCGSCGACRRSRATGRRRFP